MTASKMLSGCYRKSKWIPVFFVVTIAVVIFTSTYSFDQDSLVSSRPSGKPQSAEQDRDIQVSKPKDDSLVSSRPSGKPQSAEQDRDIKVGKPKDDIPLPQQPSSSSRSVGQNPGYKNVTQLSTVDARSKSSTHDTKVILLTYMRSGSSFTGDLFNHHSQVFYVYEPLWTLDYAFRDNEPAFFFNISPVTYNAKNKDQLPWLKRRLINASINCFIQNMHVQPMLIERFMRLSRASVPFADCVKKHPGVLGLCQCLPIMEKACVSAKVTVAKTVRLSMAQAGEFLRTDPKVKIVHLIRDPRGVLRSRITSRIVEKYKIPPEEFCSHVLQDLKDSKTLKEKFPGRIVTARYEDLTENPLIFSERLLKWAGLQKEPALDQYIRRVTSAKSTDKGVTIWNNNKKNSKTTAYNWRLKIDFPFVKKIDDSCSLLYQEMGYIRMANQSVLRNLSNPYYKNLNRMSGLWKFDG